MEMIRAAHEQDIMKWRWHELDATADSTRYDTMGDFFVNALVIGAIRNEYAFLWN